MKVLSLFSGIGAFEKALERLNVNYELVNYCEIDKYASKSYAAIHNVSESMNLGDITKVDTSVLPMDIDLVSHGSPCQDFSLAGLQAGGEKGSGTRSSLLYETVRIVADTKPKVVLWENVKNVISKKHKPVFDNYLYEMDLLGYNSYWQVLNAKDYGIPQNRERVFIVSIRKDIDPGTFEFPKPFELKLRLKDMLDTEVDEKYFLSEKMVKYVLDVNDTQKGTKWEGRADEDMLNPNIAHTLSVRGAGGNQRAGVSNFIVDGLDGEIKVKDLKEKILIKENTKKGYTEAYEGDGVYTNRPHQKRGVVQHDMIPTLTAQSQNDVGVVVKVPLKRGYSVDVKEESPNTEEIDVIGNYYKSNYNATPIVGKNGIVPTVRENHGQVTAVVVKDKVGNKFPLYRDTKQLRETIENNQFEEDEVLDMDLYNRSTNSVSQTITDPIHNKQRVFNGLRIRKLIPKECFRLMGFTDEDFAKAQSVPTSDAQLYKQAGNSIVVDVLVHIFEQLFKTIKITKSEDEKMAKKNEHKLIMAKVNKMFDIDKLIEKNPNLFNELVEKYPLKKECVYMIQYQKDEEPVVESVDEVAATTEEPIGATEEVKEGETYYLYKNGDFVNCGEKDLKNYFDEGYMLITEEEFVTGQLSNDVDDVVEEPQKVTFPEDFQPLYAVGEEFQISYEYGAIIEDIKITDIQLKTVNNERKYYYTYEVLATGEIKNMGETWLTEHEVLN